MSENKLSISVGADISDLQTKVAAAQAGLADFGSEAGAAASAAEAAFSELGAAIKAVTEVVKIAKAAFEATVGKAMEFDLSTAKFAAQMGIGADRAAGLAAALAEVGSSAGQYTALALKLDAQIKSNESGLTQLGMATRDQNGQLLGQTELMQNAISTMQHYRGGSDENTAALILFGDSAGNVFDVMRASDDAAKSYTNTLRDMGVVTGGQATQNSAALQGSIARLTNIFDDFCIALGQHVLPAFKDMIDYVSEIATPTLVAIRQLAELVFAGLDTAITGISETLQLGWGLVVEYGIAWQTLGTIIADVTTGAFSQAERDWDAGLDAMAERYKKTLEDVAQTNTAWKARMNTLFVGPAGGDSPYPSGAKSVPRGAPPPTAAPRGATELAPVRLDGPLPFMKIDDKAIDASLKRMETESNRVTRQLKKNNEELVTATEQSWRAFTKPFVSAFDQSIKGVIHGTQTLNQAMKSMAQSILNSFIDLGLKTVEDWAVRSLAKLTLTEASEAAQTGATAAGVAARTGLEAAGQETSLALHFETAIKKIASAAAETFAGVYAFFAPEIGPFAAIPAAAASVLVAGYEAFIPSAAGGYDIPSGLNPLTQLHEREMVLPARYADMIRGMTTGSGMSDGPGGGAHYHVDMSGSSFGAGLHPGQLKAAVVAALKQAHRNGAFA
jgi:hypothetical protein